MRSKWHKISKNIIFLFLIVIGGFSLSAQEKDVSIDSINNSSLVIFGCDEDYPPMSFFLNDTPLGFDSEIIESLGEVLKIEPDFLFDDWSIILDQLREGSIDVASGILYSSGRSMEFDFTIPYLSDSYTIFYKNSLEVSEIPDLEDKQLVILANDAIIENYIIPNGLENGMIRSAGYSEAFELINQGLADYTIAPYSLGQYFIKTLNLNNIGIISRPLLSIDYRFAVKKGNADLLFLLNEGIEKLHSAGELDSIYNNWDFSESFEASSSVFVAPYYMVIIGIFIVLVILLFGLSLRKRIKNKLKIFDSENCFLKNLINQGPFFVYWKDSQLKLIGFSKKNKDAEFSSSFFDFIESKDNNRKDFSVIQKRESSVDVVKVKKKGFEDDFWFKVLRKPLLDKQGALSGIAVYYEDFTETHNLKELLDKNSLSLTKQGAELEHLRITDSETGIFNKNYLYEKFSSDFFPLRHNEPNIYMLNVQIEIISPASNLLTLSAPLLKQIVEICETIIKDRGFIVRSEKESFILVFPKSNLTDVEMIGKEISQALETLFKKTNLFLWNCQTSLLTEQELLMKAPSLEGSIK